MRPSSWFESSAWFERLAGDVTALQGSQASNLEPCGLSLDQLVEGARTLIHPGQRRLVGTTGAARAARSKLCAVPIDAERKAGR